MFTKQVRSGLDIIVRIEIGKKSQRRMEVQGLCTSNTPKLYTQDKLTDRRGYWWRRTLLRVTKVLLLDCKMDETLREETLRKNRET